MHIFLSSRRTVTVALLVFSSLTIFLTFLYSPSFRRYVKYPDVPLHSCPPEAYAAGQWIHKPNSSVLSSKDDVLALSAFEGCASSREVSWHLGTSWSEEQEAQKLQWRGNASSYNWIPGDSCKGYTEVQRESLLRQLVEDGSWLVLGDSVSEGHFFSLSCFLYPHIRATPDYTIDPWSFDRAWPQNLYLNPSSPLLPQLKFPEGFEIDTTPLVTFRRVDLLLGKPELETLHSSMHHPDSSGALPPLFSEEGVWDLAPSTYLPIFFAPAPEGNYRTLVLSTAGHWTTTVFSGFHNDTEVEGNGLRGLLEFFGQAMALLVEKLVTALEEAKKVEAMQGRKQHKERQVVIRAYVHGHESCHNEQVELAGPLKEYKGLIQSWYNWKWVRRFNDVFQAVISQRAHPNIHFLPIDMPALLRPDGVSVSIVVVSFSICLRRNLHAHSERLQHTQGDCLHLLTGAGILEGWSQYISYFVSQLP